MAKNGTARLRPAQRARILRGELAAGDVAALRQAAGLSQSAFAEALGISRRTLENWEQQRVAPAGSGLALLRILARHPGILRANFASSV